MLKYLIIQLDDTSVSFCHYHNDRTDCKLMPLDILNKAIVWSMKENLTVQFLYPNYELPADYKCAILGVDHVDIVSSKCEDTKLKNNAEIVVLDSWTAIKDYPFPTEQAYVVKTTIAELFTKGELIQSILPKLSRLNVVITDIQNFGKDDEIEYSRFLDALNASICQEYKNDHAVQINILTDRLMLDSMNNCGAGVESITLAPDGKFYICPGFYLDGSEDSGNIDIELHVKNAQLYKLEYAPICRICDALQCKRCVWQNKNTTLEVNTPSREQCVMAHIEREASRNLLEKIRTVGDFMPDKEIKKINYLDPFEEIIRKQRHEH